MSLTAIILAAGKSTRMKTRKPKALLEVCGKPMLHYILRACYGAGCERILLVVGHGKDEVTDAFSGDKRIHFVEQTEALEIPNLLLCKSVQQFGIYDSFDPPRFQTGQLTQTIVYCELSHFRSKLNSDSRWETKLTYEATLYRDGDDSAEIISKKPTEIIDHCRNRRRDFFLADRLSIPSNLPVGRYLLKVTVIDQVANQVAEKTLPIVIATPAAALQ